MGKRTIGLFLAACFSISSGWAQELHAKVNIVMPRVSPGIDRKTFQTLESELTAFLNNRKWSNDAFQQKEKIDCIFTLNIQDLGAESNMYRGSVSVQAARPVYNTSYQASVINYIDPDVIFKYILYQPIEFNENRVQGTDASVANLTAVLAYYAYMILGFDYDTFSPKGGDPYFLKAQNIITNAPEGKGITGWRIFDGSRSRYWLTENLTNTRYNLIHDVIYGYYRLGLDNMYDNPDEARVNMLQALTQLQAFNKANANTMIMDFFMQGKVQELISVFKKAPAEQRARAVELLSSVDVVNAGKYKDGLK